MIKVSVLYPFSSGVAFDIGYYCASHIPMVQKLLGPACVGVSAEHGLSGGEAGAPPAFIAMGHLFFDSIEAFMASFPPHANEIMADIPNYTSINPVLQISEVRIR